MRERERRSAREQQARNHDVARKAERDQVNPGRRVAAAARGRPPQALDRVQRLGQRHARPPGHRAEQHAQHRLHLRRTEERALPAGLVAQHRAAQVEPDDQSQCHGRGGQVQPAPRVLRDERATQVGPARGIRTDRLREHRVHPRSLPNQRSDSPRERLAGPVATRGRLRLRTAMAPHPGDRQHGVSDEIPGDEAEKREGQDIDASRAIECREAQAGREREQQQDDEDPGRRPRPTQHLGDDRVALGQRSGQPVRALTERPRRQCVVDAAIRGFRRDPERAHRFARRLGTVAGREDRAGDVGRLDRLHQQHGTQGFFAHCPRILPERRPGAAAGNTLL